MYGLSVGMVEVWTGLGAEVSNKEGWDRSLGI
jgi:hypothetical protein